MSHMGRISGKSTFCYSPVSPIFRTCKLDTSLIASIHDTEGRVVMACTGGGASAVSALLGIPGGSRTVIEATVPYSESSLAAYLGGSPDQACSAATARALAMAAFQRARRLEGMDTHLLGLGCTAALATDRTRRGQDRVHVAVQSIDQTTEYTFHLSRDKRDRMAQEAACAELVIHALARALRLAPPEVARYKDESFSTTTMPADPGWTRLFAGEPAHTPHGIDLPRAVFPGAFNPLHDGHRAMAQLAEQRLGTRVLLEISAFNVDKPALDYIEMHARQAGIASEYPLTFTNAATFIEKSALFPGATFLVGADTLERIAATRYYQDSAVLRDRAIDTMASRGTAFLVFGRVAQGEFIGLDQVDIPEGLRNISTGIAESEFRVDISSSHIRRGA